MRNKKGQFVKGFSSSLKTQFKKGKNRRENSFNWKGGRRKTTNGYIMLNVIKHPRAYRNEVYEHIIIAEKKIGRYLIKGENVHHINGIKDDNRPENLMICKTWAEHRMQHRKYPRFKKNNIPNPYKLGERIVFDCKKIRVYECSECIRCKKLFWKDISKKLKGYCSHKCGTLGGRFGK